MESIMRGSICLNYEDDISEKLFSRVGYYYNYRMVPYILSENHCMKPLRITLVHDLIKNFGLLSLMTTHMESVMCEPNDIEAFHCREYFNFLIKAEKEAEKNRLGNTLRKSAIGCSQNQDHDCPIFMGINNFVLATAKGSIRAADALNKKSHEIAINWSGGFHHAHKTRASGFCYVNDCVLAIIELQKCYQKIMYIDIDVHHGDGVEEAFAYSDNVMTISFHKYDVNGFFPRTGYFNEKNYLKTINVPLNDGFNDDNFQMLFPQIINSAFVTFQPEVIVLQCGADSLAGDVIGDFNLTIKGHASAIKHVKKLNVPLLLLGGGGYCLQRTSRCWAYETAVVLGVEDQIPTTIQNYEHQFYYSQGQLGENVHFPPRIMINHNEEKDLHYTLINTLKALRV